MSDSRVITKEFEYFAPKTTEKAVSLLSQYGNRARVIAGGTDLLVGIKMGKIQPDYLVNITTIAGIDRLHASKNGFTIGAGCTFYQLENSSLVEGKYGALYEAARSVSSVQIKNMGTIGGNLCNASPASDTAPPLLVLGARANIQKPGAERQIPLEDFFVGPGEAALSEDEILTGVELPLLSSGTGSAFIKIGRVGADLAKINVAVFIKRNRDSCKECRIALGSVAKTPLRTKKAEAMMKGEMFNDELVETVAQKASEEISPITDVRSTKEYRREVARLITKKALLKAWEKAGGEKQR